MKISQSAILIDSLQAVHHQHLQREEQIQYVHQKITVINSHWLSLLPDRKQQQKGLCCPWKRCLRQIEHLSLYGSVPYIFSELCESECAGAHAKSMTFSVEAMEVSMSTGQCQFPWYGRGDSRVHYVAFLLMAGALQAFQQRCSTFKCKSSLTALHLF